MYAGTVWEDEGRAVRAGTASQERAAEFWGYTMSLLRRVAGRFDGAGVEACELVQVGMVDVLVGFPTVDFARHYAPWVRAVGFRAMTKHVRKEKRRRAVLLDYDPAAHDRTSDAREPADRWLPERWAGEVLGAVEEPQVRAYVRAAVGWDGPPMTVAEMARRTGACPQTLSQKIKQGKDQLRAAFARLTGGQAS